MSSGDDPTIETAETASTPTFVTAIVFNAIVFGVEIAVFTLIRPYFKSIYEPRSYVPKKNERISPLVPSSGRRVDLKAMFAWPFYLF
jgi:hypothetical protein